MAGARLAARPSLPQSVASRAKASTAPGTVTASAEWTGIAACPAARSTAASSNPIDVALDPLALQRAYDDGLKAAQATTGAVVPTSAGLAPVRAAPTPIYNQEQLKRGGDAPYRGEKLPEPTGIKPEFEKSGTWINQPGG